MPESEITPAVAVDILKVASAYDGRKPSELQAQVWAADLTDAGVSATDAAQAIRRHYTERPDVYVKPGHVIGLMRDKIAERQERERTARALAATADRPGVLPPGELHRRLAEATAAALAARAAREAAQTPGVSEGRAEGGSGRSGEREALTRPTGGNAGPPFFADPVCCEFHDPDGVEAVQCCEHCPNEDNGR